VDFKSQSRIVVTGKVYPVRMQTKAMPQTRAQVKQYQHLVVLLHLGGCLVRTLRLVREKCDTLVTSQDLSREGRVENMARLMC